MGIIVRDTATGYITFYMKGADTVMSKIVMSNDWLDEECGMKLCVRASERAVASGCCVSHVKMLTSDSKMDDG